MTAPSQALTPNPMAYLPQGRILDGQYVGMLRSDKGKIKGLWLRAEDQPWAIKLPKYLRPILVRELQPEAFIRVWVYPDKDQWRAINILPLPPAAIEGLRSRLPAVAEPLPPQVSQGQGCIQVCRKGSCYKRGSGEILQVLRQEIEANPTLQGVTLEATGCLKACKQGPNVRLPSGKTVSCPRPDLAKRLLQQVAGSGQ